jgi:phosphatidylserine decarboxylase
VRRAVLTALPKVLVSRGTRVLVRIAVPERLRGKVYGAYARRYGADLGEMEGTLASYPTLAAFFQRGLAAGARPVDPTAAFVWPADGRVVTAGPLAGDRVPQVKGVEYLLSDLLADAELARALLGGSQATVYLAPGDYHRVHSPFAGEIRRCHAVPGGLFPVNRPAVRCIPGLFARNERRVFTYRLDDGRTAAVVMVAALNVSDTVITGSIPRRVAKGEEIGRFGLGSTVVAIAARGEPAFAEAAPDTVVRVGGPASGASTGMP